MKWILLLLLWPSCSFGCLQNNPIDSIKTDDDVIRFFQYHCQNDNYMYFNHFNFKVSEYYEHKEYDSAAERLGVPKWVKGDIDGNGKTDLMVYDFKEHSFLLIFCLSVDKYVVQEYGDNCYPVFPKEIISKKKVIFQVWHLDTRWNREQKEYERTDWMNLICDTLYYQAGYLLNQNQNRSIKHIDSLVFEYHGGWDWGGKKVKYLNDGTLEYGITNGASKDTFFRVRPDHKIRKQIEKILQSINFSMMAKEYRVGCTDQSGATISFYCNNGISYTICDYGCNASFSLSALYQLLRSIPEIEGKISEKSQFAD